jgi:O-antigen/teichoic acid export membrane protein
MTSYRKNLISSLSTQYLNTFLTFINSIFLARILSDYGRGEYALYLNAINLFILIFSFSLPTGVIYFISSKVIGVKNILYITIAYFILMTLVLMVSLNVLNEVGLGNFILSEKYQTLFIYLICIVFFFFTSINSIISAIFNGIKKIYIYNKILISFSFITMIAFFFIYFSGYQINKSYFITIILVQAIVQCIQFIFAMFALSKQKNELPVIDTSIKKDYGKIFKFSVLVYLTNVVTFFAYKMDFWIVDHYLGKAQLGVYSVAVSLAQLIWLMPNAVAYVNLSEISSENQEEKANALTVNSFKIALYVSFLGAILFTICSFFVVPILYGNDFGKVPHYIVLLMFGVVPFAPITIISSYLAGRNLYKHNFIGSLIGVIICGVMDFALIPLYGIVGACIASSISYFAMCIYITLYFKNYTKMQFRDLLWIENLPAKINGLLRK